MYREDCLSQQEAAGCISDALSVKVNAVWFVKSEGNVFQTGLSQVPGVPWAAAVVACGGNAGEEKRAGDKTGETTGLGPLLSVLLIHIRLMGELP